MAERKAFLLRLPPELHRELEAWAAQELRSVNGQIEFLLNQAVQHRKRISAHPSGPAPAPQGVESTEATRHSPSAGNSEAGNSAAPNS